MTEQELKDQAAHIRDTEWKVFWDCEIPLMGVRRGRTRKTSDGGMPGPSQQVQSCKGSAL